MYYKARTYRERVYWEFRRSKVMERSARAITIQTDGRLRVLKGLYDSPHSHPPNREKVEAEKVKLHLKSMAEDRPEVAPAQILRTELRNVPSGVLVHLPDRESLKRTLRRGRQRGQPQNPVTLSDLGEIPVRYQRTLQGDLFLIHDSFQEEDETEDRVLIFATRRNLELLRQSSVWFLDGTFKVCPKIFIQLYVIMGIVKRPSPNLEDDHTEIPLPLVFALLSSKQQNQYTTVLREVVNRAADYGIEILSPERIMCDFEKAIINSVVAVFPDSRIICCLFHLGQSIYKKIQSEGLQESYNDPTNRQVKISTHMLLDLAFVPIQNVHDAFEQLRDYVQEELIVVLDYFEEWYITGTRARRRRRAVPPRYPINLWNHYETTRHNMHRANNISEGWQNRFQHVVAKHHPNLYSALGELQKEQSDTEVMLAEFSLGKSVRAKPKKQWMNLQKRLRTVVAQYETYKDENRLLDYLRTI